MKLILSALVAAATLAAGAAQAAPAPKQCFRVSQMQGHRVADSKTLYIGAGHKEVYRLDMAGSCLTGAAFSDPLIVESVGGNDIVCKPIDLNLKVASPIGPTPCIIRAITRLDPAQVEALPKKLRP